MSGADERPSDGAAAGRAARRTASALLVLKRTLRHYPPLLILPVAYFSVRLVTEPDRLVWTGVAISAAGFLMNLLVIAANGGRMPAAVDPDDVAGDDLYTPIDASTRLRCLSDWIDVGRWLVSPGDVLLAAAVPVTLGGRIFGLA